MKAKGIMVNYTNLRAINLKSLTDLVDALVIDQNHTNQLSVSHNLIMLDKKVFQLRTKTVTKRFRVIYEKRVLLPDFTTLPHGY